MGADSLFQIETWYAPERVMAQAILLVALRDHHSDEEMEKQIEYLKKKYDAHIQLMSMPGIDLSSNLIRQRTANDETNRFNETDPERNYI